MTMMHERVETVDLPPFVSTEEVQAAEHAALTTPTVPEDASAITDIELYTVAPVDSSARQEIQMEEPQIAPQTARAVGSLGLRPRKAPESLVTYQDRSDLTPQQRLDAAMERWGGTSASSIYAMQERNTRRLNQGIDNYNVVTALTGGYLPGTRR